MKKEKIQDEISLPVDRKQLFFRGFKNEYTAMMLCSLFQTLFSLPLYVLLLMAMIEGGAAVGLEDQALRTYAVRRWLYIFSVPCLGIFSIGAAGGMEVMKNIAWNTHSSFLKEYKKGIKKNGWYFFCVTVLYSLFFSSAAFLADVLILSTESSLGKGVFSAAAVALILLATGILMFEYSAITVYDSSLFSVIKNSFVLCLGTLPKTICILFLILLPFALAALTLTSLWLSVILLTALALVGYGYMFFLGTLYTHYVFDKHVNEKNFRSIYRKGLYCNKPDSEKN